MMSQLCYFMLDTSPLARVPTHPQFSGLQFSGLIFLGLTSRSFHGDSLS